MCFSEIECGTMSKQLNTEQEMQLLLSMEENKAIANSRNFGKGETALDRKQFYLELATALNALNAGFQKTGTEWGEYWKTYKNRNKARIAKKYADMRQRTAGGPPKEPDLSEIEKAIVSIIGKDVICGTKGELIPPYLPAPIGKHLLVIIVSLLCTE